MGLSKLTYDDVLKRADIDDSKVVCAYMYGSRVYGNFTDSSDWDFIFVMTEIPNEQFSDNLININFFTESHKQRILNHEISALETLWLEDDFILKQDMIFNFDLELPMLRRSLSRKASNSWVKAKKKLIVEKDYDLNVSKKSLWHSFRIIHYGIQIANHGKIVDYSEINDMYFEIMYKFDKWGELFEHYKKSHNKIMTEFRKLAPKN